MLGRRGFLKAVFGVSLGSVTKGVGDVIEALTTAKEANRVLNFVTASEICDAKFFVLPYIELCEPLVIEKPL
jgi:hypothetical protein